MMRSIRVILVAMMALPSPSWAAGSNETCRPMHHCTSTKPGTAHAAFVVQGVFCADCVTNISQRLHQLPGFEGVSIATNTGKGMLSYDPRKVQPSTLIQAIDQAGYRGKLAPR